MSFYFSLADSMWTRDAYNVNNKKQARLTLLWILLEEGKREPGCRDVS